MTRTAGIRATALLLLGVVALTTTQAQDALAPRDGDWDFSASLDGKPIGEHRFTVRAAGVERTVTSSARFDVKLLGISVYRYRHDATEQWRDDCLTRLDASTDDNGAASQTRGETDAGRFRVTTEAGSQALDGCVKTYAYWNPAIRQQTRLLNAQTGKYDPVRLARIGSGEIMVRGKPVNASRWRIENPEKPIDVWYADDGQWVGLDSTVSGGRNLSYRLK